MPTLQLTLLSAAIAGALGFGSAWKLQSLRADSLEKTHVEQKLAQEQEAHRFDQARSSAVIAAQNDGLARQAVLRADAAHSRDALDGLRASSARALSAARADPVACVVNNTQLDKILSECSGQLQTVARDADLWQSDAMMLREAWPK